MIPLPIDPELDAIAAAAARGPLVVEAPTGAGKTTRIPPHLRPEGQVLLVEPRRVAARAAARRIASERGWKVGREVGWHVRFDRTFCAETRVLCVTGGILLRRLQADPFLEGVGAVVFDEVHERALELDLGLALVAELREARPELMLVAMSATLDGAELAGWLGGARITSAGRAWPVEIRYAPRPDARPVEERVADGVAELLPVGDVLAFLPGVREIRRTAALLGAVDADVLPLHGSLSPEAQDAALVTGRGRRVVLATNLAESSLTVPGVRAVVDAGLARQQQIDPSTGLDALCTVPISRASADQRAGRAGREAAGVCLRLWTERAHADRRERELPEIHRTSLAGPALHLLDQGIDPAAFRWLEPPRPEALERALALLEALGALQGSGLSERGRALCRLPLHPRLGVLLLEASRLGCARQGALAAAWLSERDALWGWTASERLGCDLTDRVEALERGGGRADRRRRVLQVAHQLERRAGRAQEHLAPREALPRAALAAWPDRVCRRRGASRRGRRVGGGGVVLTEGSGVTAELWVALALGPPAADRPVSVACPVDRADLSCVEDTELRFEGGEVRARSVVRYGDLELEARPVRADPVAASALLCARATDALERVQPEHRAWTELVARLRSLHVWDPDGWPDVDRELLAPLLPELCRGLRSFEALRKARWEGALRAALGHRVVALDRLAPERIEVPRGRVLRLRYEPGGPPVLAARIQELFGLSDTPTVAGGRVRVRLELLAPSRRPVQITEDLAGFWARTWPEVRKELRGRYPKHAWPVDPTKG